MVVIRVFPSLEIHNAILEAAGEFESKVKDVVSRVTDWSMGDVIMTERQKMEGDIEID